MCDGGEKYSKGERVLHLFIFNDLSEASTDIRIATVMHRYEYKIRCFFKD